MKVKISAKRNFKIFFIAFIICGVALFLCCINLFIFTKPWTFVQWMLIAIYLSLSLLLLIVSFVSNYYLINRSNFEVHKFGRVIIYDYKNIIFIDEVEGNKGKTIAFMTNKDSNLRYLSFDKNGELYENMLLKCKNRLTREEFHAKYPHVKL